MKARQSLYSVLIVLVLGSAVPLAADPPSQVGRLGLITGTVSFSSDRFGTDSYGQWVPATLNYPLTSGCRLWSDWGGRAEIQLASATVRLDALTEISFVNLDDQVVQVGLSAGSLDVTLWNVDPGDLFEVDTLNTSVSLASEGSYRINVLPNGDTSIIVRRGRVQVRAGSATLDVLQGQSAIVAGYGSVSFRFAQPPALDDWDRWCAARDARWQRLHFTGGGMIGIQDLDDYGMWVTVAVYGRVWVPSGVPTGWAPYHFGHWAWVDPWGWTWIDDAPWGFAPFHYGRWAFVSGRWCWVPGTVTVRAVYAPALVVFIGGAGWGPGGNGVGWFPLGPGEVYLPPYAAGDTYFVSINLPAVPHVTVEVARTTHVDRINYVNRSNPQAVTIVPRDTFVKSQPVDRAGRPLPAGEIRQAPVIVRPPVAPERDSYAGREVKPDTPVSRPSPEVGGRKVLPPQWQAPGRAQQEKPEQVQVRPPQEAPAQQPGRGSQEKPEQVQVRPPQEAPAQQPGRGSQEKPEQVQVRPPQEAPAQQPGRGPQEKPEQVQVRPPQEAPAQQPGRAQQEDTGQQQAASALIAGGRQNLASVEQRLTSARKTAGLQFDFNAANQQLASARALLADADKALKARSYVQASQAATAAQREINAVENALTAALNRAQAGSGQGEPPRQGGGKH